LCAATQAENPLFSSVVMPLVGIARPDTALA
jgi:hypothetical protein